MANAWDEKIKGFLKKTGEDVRRAGNDIKGEAQKLLSEVKDPEGQAKIKEGIKDFGGWAKKTATEMAELAETGLKKAEGAFRQAGENWKVPPPGGETAAEGEAPAPAPSITPPSAPPEMDAPPPPPAKTIGKKKTEKAEKADKPPAPAKPKGSKKTMGKKPAG